MLPSESSFAVATGTGVRVPSGVGLAWQGFGYAGVGVAGAHVGVAVGVFGVTTAKAVGDP